MAYVHENPRICILIAEENVDFGKSVGSAVCAARAHIHENHLPGPPVYQLVTNKLKLQALKVLVMLEQLKKQKPPPFRRLYRHLLANLQKQLRRR